jgi:stalled ribosome rescue protein Dom34
MANHNAAVWLDHNEAKIFHVGAESYDEATILAPKAHTQLHRKSGPGADSGHRAQEDQHYYHSVASALGDAETILVLGPSTAKLQLLRHVHKHDPQLETRIVGVETVDHPSDRQLVAFIRNYFREADLMRA